MNANRQVASTAPKKSISIRFKVEDLETINHARSIVDETFQRFAVKRMLEASTAIIKNDSTSSRTTLEK